MARRQRQPSSTSKPAGRGRAQKTEATTAAVQTDLKPAKLDEAEALRLVMQMMALPGLSCREGLVAQFIMDQLRQAGAAESRHRSRFGS